jgi:hypothetical protein
MTMEIGNSGYLTESELVNPTNQLRWLTRDGEKILQQLWTKIGQDRFGYATYAAEEWRDIPVANGENANEQNGDGDV